MTKYKKEVEVSIPQAHDLGFCPINHISEFPFTIFNPNSKPLQYIFKFTEFIVLPSKGVLLPNSVANFRIQFKPSQATVIVGTIVLEVEGQTPKVYRVSAVGKYPFISLAQNQVSFDEVSVSKNSSRELFLKNGSEVSAHFKLLLQQGKYDFQDNFYTIQPSSGIIPPKMNYQLKINYQPKFMETNNISKFKMICASGNSESFSCQGYGKKLDIFFNTNSVNFGQVKLQAYSSKALTIINNSQIDSEFEFFTDSNNIFLFSDIKGTINKNCQKKIILQFRPRNTINYYERVYCLVRNHGLQYVDLLGTCYDLLIKPVPLLQTHIDQFRKRVIEGRISQIQLRYIENNALLKMSKRKQLGQEYANSLQQNFYQSNKNFVENNYTLLKELFLQSKNNELINITEDNVEFGHCEMMTLSGQRQIEVVNRLQCKLSLFWIPQKRENLNGQYMTVFQVYPENATLKPNVPVKFTITFRPLKSATFYFQHLQYFAIKHSQKITKKTLEDFEYKELKSKPQNTLLRNVKLNQTIQTRVKEQLQTTEVFPPLSGIVRCSGHSFSNSSLPYLPIMKVYPNKNITFKPALRNCSTYESIKLVNHSDTPIYYKFGPDPTKAFRVYPKIGLIEPKGFCIVGLQFTPSDYKTYKSTVSIALNDMPGSSNVKLHLTGICTQPELHLENDNKLFFTPTSIGVYSKKSYKIENLSKNNLIYKVKVPEKYENELYFEPPERQLSPNEAFSLDAYFTPASKRKYKIRVPIQAWETSPQYDSQIGYHSPGSGSLQKQQKKALRNIFQVQVNGEGADGSIKLSQSLIDFKTVKISENKKIGIKIKNDSECAFYLDICLKNEKIGKEGGVSENQISNAFKLDYKNGVIPGNSQIDLAVTFSPLQVAKFDLVLIVSARERIPKKVQTMKSKGIEPVLKSQMKVKAVGNFPLLEIIDIRNDSLSVAALWQNFQITQINQALITNLNQEEKMFLGIENLTFNETKNLESRLKNYEWNLGYVSAKWKDRPRKVIITVRNFGGTALDYIFKFPSDNKVQEQLWADPGEPTEQEAYEKAILQKKIFQIKPKVGHLEPNEVKDIQLIYSPAALDFSKTAGSSSQLHYLKVVFQVLNGKSLVFNLKGTTLGPNEGLLTVKKNHYELPNTPIGLMTPLRFPIELSNVGSIKINYKTEIEYEEGEFEEVFKIQNPSNFLLSGQNSYLYCLYKPLIKKKYEFKITVNVFDFSKIIQNLQLTFSGSSDDPVGQNNSLTQSIPRQRTSVSEVGSKVYFSIEDIDFGVMKTGSTKYRMIILYNMSNEQSLNFDFPTQSQTNFAKMGLTCGDKFIIQPNCGNLQPNSFIELKLTLTSNEHPSIYEGQIPCNVTWTHQRYSMDDNEATQKQIALTAKKETLFLRISKSTQMDVILQVMQGNDLIKGNTCFGNMQKKSVIDVVFGDIIGSVLNDPELVDEIGLLQKESCELLDLVDQNKPVFIDQKAIEQEKQPEQKRDYNKYDNLFLNEQFKDVTQLIMENTFFNIVQETTHKENDFLRVAKKFIPASTEE